jgi:ribosome modulation factor
MSDSRELAQPEQSGGAVAHRQDSQVSIPMDQQMAMMREALTNPDVDPSKAREMLALMRELQQDARQAEFNRAKIAAIRAMPAIYKRGQSNNHRYAKFEDLHRAVMPVLAAHLLTLDFRIGAEGNAITVQPILRHDNGYVEEGGIMKGPPDTAGSKSPVQAIGSTASYLKRHSMKAMLNIIEDAEDDDGAGGGGRQLNDRQSQLLVDAQEAFERGQYQGYFQRLPAKDKALLINSGKHAEWGGQQALPGAQQQTAERREEPSQEPQGGQRAKRTPLQQVEAYEAGVKGCKTLDALREYQTEEVRARWIMGLRERDPELHQRVVEANAARFQELGGGAPAGDGSGDLSPGE